MILGYLSIFTFSYTFLASWTILIRLRKRKEGTCRFASQGAAGLALHGAAQVRDDEHDDDDDGL